MSVGLNALTGCALSGSAHIRQSVGDILSTPVGSRVMRRDYGSRLPELMDAPVTADLFMDVYAETAAALAKWEPRFRLSSVSVAEAGDGRLVLDLYGEDLVNGEPLAMEGVIV